MNNPTVEYRSPLVLLNRALSICGLEYISTDQGTTSVSVASCSWPNSYIFRNLITIIVLIFKFQLVFSLKNGAQFVLDFKKNVTKRPIRNVNLYQMMCRLTNLVPAPHNGTWSEVCDLLADDGACATTVSNMAVVTAHIPVLISFYLLALLLMGSPM